MSAWTQKQKETALARYLEICESEYETDEQRAENATEIVKQIAEELDKTVNGTRIILHKSDKYIPQKSKAAPAKTGAKTGGSKMSKADQIQALKDVIIASTPEGTELDDTVLDKLTGKAAAYFTELFLATKGE
jgi:hypothetical protein